MSFQGGDGTTLATASAVDRAELGALSRRYAPNPRHGATSIRPVTFLQDINTSSISSDMRLREGKMLTCENLNGDSTRLTPIALASLLPTQPVLSSGSGNWKDLVLQRYKQPPAKLDVPGMRDHLLILHLAGPVMIEHLEGGARQKCWYPSGYMNLLPAGQPVSRVLNGRTDTLCMHIAPDLLAEVAEQAYDVDPARAYLVPQLAMPDESLHRIGRLLLTEAETGLPATRLMAQSLGCALALHLLRCYSNLGTAKPERPHPIPGGRLKRVIAHMREHLDEDLTLAQLSSVSGLSQSQFTRAFREATGHPPHRFLITMRCERARELLEQTSLSVIEIGMQCGFERPNHFATIFRKVTGMSPRAWRIARRI